MDPNVATLGWSLSAQEMYFVEKEKIDQIIANFPETRGNLIAIFHEIQNEFRYLPRKGCGIFQARSTSP